MRETLIFILLLTSTISFAQNEANIWYFGNNAGLDFNSGVPVALAGGQMATQEGCASIANSSGQLQFYSDGSTVWNRNHTIMSNGIGLNGNFSSTQSAIIVPKPSSPNMYYIFTVDYQGQVNGLQYSEVNMNLDGGLGAITTNKNILLITPVLEKLTAVKHANGNDIWVIAHKNGSAEFYAYLVTSTGIQTPIITDIGFSYSGPFFDENAGYMKVSPNGQRLVMAFPKFTNGLQLFDFNNATGVITNHINVYDVPVAAKPYGVEFSPSGNILYVAGLGSSGGVAQFDITLPTAFQILSSVTFLSNNITDSDWGAVQLAPDGKIYITRRAYDNTPDIHTLSVINNPDVLGGGCDFQLDTISLGTGIAQSGLPPFIQSFFLVGIIAENTCFGNATQFQANISESYDSILWDFGDSNTSTVESPSHTYTSPGTYTVTITVTSGTEITSDTAEVIIYEQPIANQPSNILICDDDNDGFYNFDLTTQNTSILNGQSDATFDINYYASINDFNNGNAISTPETYTNTTAYVSQTIIARIENTENNQCEDMTTFTIQVFESPTPNTNVPTISTCDNTSVGTDSDGMILFDVTQNETTILNGQSATTFSVTYFTDAGFTNQITNPSSYQNTVTNETIYVRVVNNTNLSCIGQTSFNIEVYELPTITSIVELKQCDDDLDGYSIFNLNEVINEISINAASETISFYESQADAENQNTPITNTISYINQSVSTDTVWARIENSNGCFRTNQINLIVSTTQIPNTFTRDFYECDDAISGTTNDGISAFNFTLVNSEIQALFPTGQQLIISYYRNQTDALTEQNAITDISNYRNIGYPTTQNIYIRVDSALDNDCLGLGNHITLHVETVPVANTIIIPEECDNDGDGMFEFDTSTIETTLLNGQTNVSVIYTDGNGNPLSNPLPNPFITASQTITARVTNNTSQDTDGACYDETSIIFTVEAAAIATIVAPLSTCDYDSDGLATFDTSTIETTVLNGQTGMIVTYVDENGNTLPSPLPNPFITTSQTITVKVENPLNTICFDETTVEFIVYETPTAFPIENDIVCDDASNDGEETFILSNYNSQVLNGQSNSSFEVLYFGGMIDAENNNNSLSNNYTLNSSQEIIYARIHNRNNTDCYNITSFQIGIAFFPIATQPDDLHICDDEDNDGIFTVNLSSQNSIILDGQSATENTITYHLSQSDAENGANNLNTFFENTSNPQVIYVRLENNDHPDCYTITSFAVNVIAQPILTMNDVWSICEDESIEVIADGGFDEYVWSTGDTTQTITIDQAGTYELTVANVQGGIRCESSKTITVFESTIATIVEIDKTDWTQNNNTITVQVEGNGDYEYSINGINYQDENTFSNLLIDDYLVHVRDKNGCGIVTEEVYLLYYPNFFTPNGDGYNDTWQLVNSSKEPLNRIYIFDRFGKIIKELKPDNLGWNGTYKGNPMPSADYWFLVERQDGKQYKGNFSLKR